MSKLRKQGKSPANALICHDQKSLVLRTSKDYQIPLSETTKFYDVLRRIGATAIRSGSGGAMFFVDYDRKIDHLDTSLAEVAWAMFAEPVVAEVAA